MVPWFSFSWFTHSISCHMHTYIRTAVIGVGMRTHQHLKRKRNGTSVRQYQLEVLLK